MFFKYLKNQKKEENEVNKSNSFQYRNNHTIFSHLYNFDFKTLS